MNYALELIDYGNNESLVSPKEFSSLSSLFASTTDLAAWIPDFPERAKIAHFADVVSYALHRQIKKGIPEGFNGIGNPWVVSRRGRQPKKIEVYKPVISDGTSQHVKTIHLDARTE